MSTPSVRAPTASMFPPSSVRPPSGATSSARPSASPPSQRAAIRLRASLARLMLRLRNLNVSDFECGDRPPTRLEALARSVAAEVRAILDDTGAHYEASPPSIGASVEAILDLVFIARMELSGVAELLSCETGVSTWQRVATCDSVLQVSRRCLRALDTLIADAEGLARQPDDNAEEVASAVQVRLAYVELHRTAMGPDLPDSETIRPRLHGAGNCIARTLGRTVASSIRAHDRHAMRMFQTRIREALLAPHGDASVDALIRVWQDLTNFTALLLDVNKREELRVFDRESLGAALAALQHLAPAAPCPPPVAASLQPCAGRDAELDALLAGDAPVGALRQCIQRVLASLAPQTPHALQMNTGTWSGLL